MQRAGPSKGWNSGSNCNGPRGSSIWPLLDGLLYLCGSSPRLTMLCDRLDLCKVSKCRSLVFRFEASFTQSKDINRQPVRYRPAQRPNLEIDIVESKTKWSLKGPISFYEYTKCTGLIFQQKMSQLQTIPFHIRLTSNIVILLWHFLIWSKISIFFLVFFGQEVRFVRSQ